MLNRIVENRDPVDHVAERHGIKGFQELLEENLTKPTQPPLTRTSDAHQIDWTADQLVGIGSPQQHIPRTSRRPPAGTAIPIEGLTTQEARPFPMAVQQLNAPSRAPSRSPRTGVVHVRARHADRFTVVGNHLAQHRELSLMAIGVAVHIQSLPDGARVDIRTLTARFPEGEARIAAALRELETYGYLARTRERLPSGRVVTHTVSYARPGRTAQVQPHRPIPRPQRPVEPPPPPEPLPQPRTADPAHTRTAAALLVGLRRTDTRLLLSEDDVRRLTPAVATWLERDAAPEAVRRTLTTALPEPLRHPAALLARRLTVQLPPPLPAAPSPASRPHPLRNCPGCDRAFRAPPAEERCRTCARKRGADPETA